MCLPFIIFFALVVRAKTALYIPGYKFGWLWCSVLSVSMEEEVQQLKQLVLQQQAASSRGSGGAASSSFVVGSHVPIAGGVPVATE